MIGANLADLFQEASEVSMIMEAGATGYGKTQVGSVCLLPQAPGMQVASGGGGGGGGGGRICHEMNQDEDDMQVVEDTPGTGALEQPPRGVANPSVQTINTESVRKAWLLAMYTQKTQSDVAALAAVKAAAQDSKKTVEEVRTAAEIKVEEDVQYMYVLE